MAELFVRKTEERGEARGEYIAQLNPTTAKKNLDDARVGDYLLLEKEHGQRKFRTLARLQHLCNNIKENEIRIDQTLRTAIDALEKDKILVKKAKPPKKGFWERLLTSQVELMRVKKASPDDVEKKVCRIPRGSMVVIGVEEGDFVKAESPDGQKQEKLRALIMEERHYPDCREMLKLRGRDLPEISLDNDARTKLDVKVCDAVRVSRDVSHVLFKKFHELSIPIAVLVVGIVAALNIPIWAKVVVLILGLVTIALLHLIELRKKLSP